MMWRIALYMFPIFFLVTPLCGAQDQNQEGIDHLLSLDLAYSVIGLMNQGWGIGLRTYA